MKNSVNMIGEGAAGAGAVQPLITGLGCINIYMSTCQFIRMSITHYVNKSIYPNTPNSTSQYKHMFIYPYINMSIAHIVTGS